MFENILTSDDTKALLMLFNGETMLAAEKRHYIIGVHWDKKIIELTKYNSHSKYFSNDDLKVIAMLVNGLKLNSFEKIHYILGSDIIEKVEHLHSLYVRVEKLNYFYYG